MSNPIAVYSGNTVIYWSAIVISLGLLASLLMTLSLQRSDRKPGFLVYLLLPLTVILSVPLCRLLHWYCHAEQYGSFAGAMTDDLHYLLMTINHTPDARPRATINELARIIYSKNVKKAYTLDGGQTAEIIMMGGPINHVDFGYERIVSDIIYFATALPEEVRP